MPLDTRHWVGLTCRDVSHHAWTCEQFARDRLPFPACEAVWAEACFLMDRRGSDAAKALKMTERGVVPLSMAPDRGGMPTPQSVMFEPGLGEESHRRKAIGCPVSGRAWSAPSPAIALTPPG